MRPPCSSTSTAPRVRLPLVVLAAALLVTAPAMAQDGAPAPTGAQDGASAPDSAQPSASERLGIHAGTHRVTLFGGVSNGGTALGVNIVTTPLDEEVYHGRYDLESSSSAGLSYAYFPKDRWGIELTYEAMSTELMNANAMTREEMTDLVGRSSVDPSLQEGLVDRLVAHSGPYDMDLTFVDVGGVWIAKSGKRFMVEVGAGLGWATGSVAGGHAVFEELVVSRQEQPGDIIEVANELVDPTNGEGCPADNDPCAAFDDGGGLTWHVGAGASIVFTKYLALRLGVKLRNVTHVLDPGDAFLNFDSTLGLAFTFGGR